MTTEFPPELVARIVEVAGYKVYAADKSGVWVLAADGFKGFTLYDPEHSLADATDLALRLNFSVVITDDGIVVIPKFRCIPPLEHHDGTIESKQVAYCTAVCRAAKMALGE